MFFAENTSIQHFLEQVRHRTRTEIQQKFSRKAITQIQTKSRQFLKLYRVTITINILERTSYI